MFGNYRSSFRSELRRLSFLLVPVLEVQVEEGVYSAFCFVGYFSSKLEKNLFLGGFWVTGVSSTQPSEIDLVLLMLGVSRQWFKGVVLPSDGSSLPSLTSMVFRAFLRIDRGCWGVFFCESECLCVKKGL